MKYFKLPDLGEGLQEAEIVEWHVKAGDTVKADQQLVSVETAKAIVDIPAPYDGVVAQTFGTDGSLLHVGEPLLPTKAKKPARWSGVWKVATTARRISSASVRHRLPAPIWARGRRRQCGRWRGNWGLNWRASTAQVRRGN